MSNLAHVTTDRFDEEVLGAPQPVLVDFYATWCGPCKILGPVLENLANAFDGRARVVKVDVDQEAALANRFGITGVPTVMLFRDGEVTYQAVGLPRPQEIWNALEKVTSSVSSGTEG